MAEVFRAKSFGVEGFEKIIAIKRILPSMAEDAEFVQMFIDEAKIAGQLSHANICQIFELGKLDGTHFIAMEYIWGKDLLQISNRLRKLGQKALTSMACFVAAKVCEALDYAHRRKDPQGKPLQIIHRDVSPQNVLVSYEGRGQDHRLWHRQGGLRRSARRRHARPACSEGQVRLHVARAGARAAARSALGCLRHRDLAPRGANRREAVRQRQRLHDPRAGAQRRG